MPRNPAKPDPKKACELLVALHLDLASGQVEIGEAIRRMRHISGLT